MTFRIQPSWHVFRKAKRFAGRFQGSGICKAGRKWMACPYRKWDARQVSGAKAAPSRSPSIPRERFWSTFETTEIPSVHPEDITYFKSLYLFPSFSYVSSRVQLDNSGCKHVALYPGPKADSWLMTRQILRTGQPRSDTCPSFRRARPLSLGR
jgi:hypothetical protein